VPVVTGIADEGRGVSVRVHVVGVAASRAVRVARARAAGLLRDVEASVIVVLVDLVARVELLDSELSDCVVVAQPIASASLIASSVAVSVVISVELTRRTVTVEVTRIRGLAVVTRVGGFERSRYSVRVVVGVQVIAQTVTVRRSRVDSVTASVASAALRACSDVALVRIGSQGLQPLASVVAATPDASGCGTVDREVDVQTVRRTVSVAVVVPRITVAFQFLVRVGSRVKVIVGVQRTGHVVVIVAFHYTTQLRCDDVRLSDAHDCRAHHAHDDRTLVLEHTRRDGLREPGTRRARARGLSASQRSHARFVMLTMLPGCKGPSGYTEAGHVASTLMAASAAVACRSRPADASLG
jgi:hypothetical protein